MTSVNAVPNSLRCRATAAGKVFEDHADFIRTVIYSQIQDEDQAEELTQAFYVSFILRPLPVGIQNVKGYLYKAIMNDIADANRRTRRYGSFIFIYAELFGHPARQKTPHERLIQEEEAKRIFELIEKRLPHSEAKAITLRYREHQSVREAAEKMGVDSMTLKGYVCDGLSRIRRLLKNIEANAVE